MNQLIKKVNDKMIEVYQRNPTTRVNYLDGWKLSGGYVLSSCCLHPVQPHAVLYYTLGGIR